MRWTSKDIPDQSGRTAIVTGANTGIGLETARALANSGARVILASRNEPKGMAALDTILAGAPRGRPELAILDLADLASVRSFVGGIREQVDRLDLLVNNAGVMAPPYRKTTDGFELQLGTNHLGHFALSGLLLGLLLKADGSCVVNVSSTAHRYGTIDFDDLHSERKPYRKMKSYCQSKLANLLFTHELQRKLDAAGVGTIAVASHPGWTATDLQRYNLLFRVLNPVFAMKPGMGALPTLRAATADDVRAGEYYGPGGFGEVRGHPKRVEPDPASHDEGIARRLWTVSEKLTGVTSDALAGIDD